MKLYGTENNEFIMKEVGNRIQSTRIAMSLTQKEMALRAGISARTVERIENGENVKVDNILNILRTLRLLENIDLLISEQEVSPSELYQHRKKRKRATSKQKKEKESDWKWGDEE